LDQDSIINPKHFHGKPCKKCGATLRYKRNRRCVECKKKENHCWSEGNRERTRSNSRRYYYANLEERLKKNRAYRKANPGKDREQRRRYRQENRERIRKINRRYYYANPEKVRAGVRRWGLANPNRLRFYSQRRRALKYTATVENVIDTKVFARNKWTCGICDKPVDPDLRHPDPMSASLDHIIPLSRGGDHSYANTQCTHLVCNLRKHNKYDGPNPDGSSRWFQLTLF